MQIQLVSITFTDKEPFPEDPTDRHMTVKYRVVEDDGSVREIRTEGSDVPNASKNAIDALFSSALTNGLERASIREKSDLLTKKAVIEAQLAVLESRS